MAGSERDPTPGELRVMLENLEKILTRLEGNVATKEFVDAKFDAYSERTVRLEDDLKQWIRTSTEAHVDLANKIQSLEKQTESEIEVVENQAKHAVQDLEARINTKFEKMESEQRQDRSEVKSVKNSRITSWVGIGLAFLLNIAFWYATSNGGGQ